MRGRRTPVLTRELIVGLSLSGMLQREIAAEVGVSVATVKRVLASVGDMSRPLEIEYDGRYLSRDERREIARLREEGHSIRSVAAVLGRAPSTISRELRRNVDERTGNYLPEHAHTKAWRTQRRPKDSKIASNPALAWLVQLWLVQARFSPEQIAGRLKRLFPHDGSMQISHESIYQSLFVYPRGELTRELKAALRSGRAQRRPRGHRNNKHDRIRGLVSIHERPAEVEGRLVPGHHEGDLIKGSLASNSAVGTIVERHSGYLTLLHLPHGHTADRIAQAVSEQMTQFPAWFAKTLTWDRGAEMARHAEITAKTGIAVYFADPYSPHQRPSNENTNGLLREYLPKGTDLSLHSANDLDDIAWSLNHRPRKRLDYRTPHEVFTSLIEQNQQGVASTP